ncbi:MAG: glycosyltransferase family 1 protein [Patescibacteria group bacterium]|jgi:glycosyltransferase involved in cell wall biosynthesis
MRVGIDARFYGGEQSKGLGRYTQKLIEYLSALDTQNEYCVFLQEEEFKNWKIKNKNFQPIEAPYRWYSLAEQIFMPFKIKQANVDFMHFPHFNVPLFYRGPFIVTIHDLIISRFPTERATTLGPWLYKIKQVAYHRVMKHAALDSQKIITVSEYSKKDIIDYFNLPEEKIAITKEGTDFKPVAEINEDEQKKVLAFYGIHKPFLLYVGNAYPHKNLEILLKVVKRLKREKRLDWKLVLVGKKDYFYNRLEQQAWAMDLDKDIIFPGFVKDKDLPYFYAKSIAYIFPSRYEGFGLPPLEAMAYGTPVLAAYSACLPEILEDAALYFDNEDVYGIIKQIKKVITDPKVKKVLITKGLKQIKKYRWEKTARQTLKIYEQTAARIIAQNQSST